MQIRHLPNAISLVRLMMVPVLIWLVDAGSQQAFAWLLLAAGVSDVVDGWLARTFGWTSAVGALLDSIADVLVVLVVLYGIWQLKLEVLTTNWPVFGAVAAIWAMVHAAALFRYRRLASFHTHLTRVGLMLFGAFVLVLFFAEFQPWLFYVSGAIGFLGGVESLVMVILTPTWEPDLRGGLVAVIRRRRASG